MNKPPINQYVVSASSRKEKKDSWFTTMRFENKDVFYKIPI